MLVINMVNADFVHAVEGVVQIRFAVHAHILVGGQHDATDDALLGGDVRALVQVAQMGQQQFIDEGKQRALARLVQLLALGAMRRRPVLPAEGALQRGRKIGAQRLRLHLLARLLRVKQAQEQNPGQFWHILQRAGAVGAAHDVAHALDEGRERLRGGDGLGRLGGFCGAGHGQFTSLGIFSLPA